MRLWRVSLLGYLLIAIAIGCSESAAPEVPGPTDQDAQGAGPGDPDPVAECDSAPDGTPCGGPGSRMHCVFDACVRNACGDQVAADYEECDDGNQNSGDGCSARCRLESCGNHAVDLGEECDDGNREGGDGCSARCKAERCGNRVVDPQEQCDDGNAVDLDGCSNACVVRVGGVDGGSMRGDGGTDGSPGADSGDAAPDTGAGEGGEPEAGTGGGAAGPDTGHGGHEPDGGAAEGGELDGGEPDGGEPEAGDAAAEGGSVAADSGPVPDPRSEACLVCVEGLSSGCRNFQGSGADLVGNCLENPDPSFAQRCADAYLCSLAATDGCADDLTRGAASCYCGLNRTIDVCFEEPSATTGPDGACIPQWEAATGCAPGDLGCVGEKFVDLTLPAGWAAALVSCTADPAECGSSCR